ncbi:MAG: hypothetical protein A3I66_03650 [Burkholderiales bacterium RIFCSPLOWO2_02_FULL_57_36]|nr:MAG: hypothetical protein A3I66_03650 [Burkholderiales bacterium RIFCSPLOWO2_02_FULL_57_36]
MVLPVIRIFSAVNASDIAAIDTPAIVTMSLISVMVMVALCTHGIDATGTPAYWRGTARHE